MPESLSRRHLLALSSGAAFSVLATACGASSSDIMGSNGKASDGSVPEPTASTGPTSAAVSRSIRRAEPLPVSALDGRGPVILPDRYFEREGVFSSGTLSHRAVNVPRPLKPKELSERSVEGLHSFLQYWSAAQNYMFLTGNTEPFMDLPGQERFNHMTNMYRDIYRYNIGWLVSKSNAPLCINLDSAQPVPVSTADVYCWKATLKVDESAFLFNHETLQRELLTKVYGHKSQADVYVYFGEEGWQMLEDPQASPSAIATPSTGSSAQSTPNATPSAQATAKATRYLQGSK